MTGPLGFRLMYEFDISNQFAGFEANNMNFSDDDILIRQHALMLDVIFLIAKN